MNNQEIDSLGKKDEFQINDERNGVLIKISMNINLGKSIFIYGFINNIMFKKVFDQLPKFDISYEIIDKNFQEKAKKLFHTNDVETCLWHSLSYYLLSVELIKTNYFNSELLVENNDMFLKEYSEKLKNVIIFNKRKENNILQRIIYRTLFFIDYFLDLIVDDDKKKIEHLENKIMELEKRIQDLERDRVRISDIESFIEKTLPRKIEDEIYKFIERQIEREKYFRDVD